MRPIPLGRASLCAAALLATTPVASQTPSAEGPEVFAGQPHLDRESLVREVLQRNPTAQAAEALWRSAAARVRTERALEDPMLRYEIAPLSVFSNTVPLGHSVALEQRFAFPGTRGLKGEVAASEAEMAKADWREAQLRLALAASVLYDEWYATFRSLEINAEHLDLLRVLKKSAEAQYVVGRASQQDPLQAEVELSHLLHDKVVLETQRDALRADLNGLLRRAPTAALPPPPKRLSPPAEQPPPSEALQAVALERRPELAGTAAAIEGGRAEVALARRAYLPDFALMASYNSMWMDAPHRFAVGVSLNLPVYLGPRAAAVDAAEAALVKKALDREALATELRVEVDKARARLVESMHLLHLYDTRLLPAARDQVAAARAGFEAGRNNFPALIDAEKNLRSVALRAQMELAAVHKRRAELQRLTGELVLPPDSNGGAR